MPIWYLRESHLFRREKSWLQKFNVDGVSMFLCPTSSSNMEETINALTSCRALPTDTRVLAIDRDGNQIDPRTLLNPQNGRSSNCIYTCSEKPADSMNLSYDIARQLSVVQPAIRLDWNLDVVDRRKLRLAIYDLTSAVHAALSTLTLKSSLCLSLKESTLLLEKSALNMERDLMKKRAKTTILLKSSRLRASSTMSSSSVDLVAATREDWKRTTGAVVDDESHDLDSSIIHCCSGSISSTAISLHFGWKDKRPGQKVQHESYQSGSLCRDIGPCSSRNSASALQIADKHYEALYAMQLAVRLRWTALLSIVEVMRELEGKAQALTEKYLAIEEERDYVSAKQRQIREIEASVRSQLRLLNDPRGRDIISQTCPELRKR